MQEKNNNKFIVVFLFCVHVLILLVSPIIGLTPDVNTETYWKKNEMPHDLENLSLTDKKDTLWFEVNCKFNDQLK